MGTNTLVYNGNQYTGDKQIIDGSFHLETSLTGEALAIDTMSATIENSKTIPTIFCPKGTNGLLTREKTLFGVFPHFRVLMSDLGRYTYGTPIRYYRGAKLVGLFFVSSVSRVGKFSYELSCVSAIGLLDNVQHYGGIYEQVRLDALIGEIASGLMEYRVDSVVAGITLSGWLPIASRRDNLHQVLFASGVSVKKDADGITRFSYLENTNKAEIEEDRVFIGGSIDYKSPATKVVVTEHTYIKSAQDEPVQLYQGELSASSLVSPKGAILVGKLLQFKEPIHDLSIQGASILESGVNYAVLGQSAECTLSGLKYTHVTGEISKGSDNSAGAENTVFALDCTLVSAANSDNIARKLLSYHASAKLVSTGIVVENERPGIPAALKDPFDDQVDGFIQSMDGNFSSLARANVVFADGFIPVAPGNTFSHFVVLTGSGSFAVPQGVGLVRVACISAGTGAGAGQAGEPGTEGKYETSTSEVSASITYYMAYFEGKSGAGGGGGVGGAGGKVLESNLVVVPGQTFQYSCGQPGTGATVGGEDGSAGGVTTFWTLSSAAGVSYRNGYKNILNGSLSAVSGGNGRSGGRGTGTVDEDEVVVYGDPVTVDGVAYHPGAPGTYFDKESDWNFAGGRARAHGGFGGGAAAGLKGFDGSNGFGTVSSRSIYAYPGAGANGADATRLPAPQPVYGGGGNGGHGGGGGGGHGRGIANFTKAKGYPVESTPYQVTLPVMSKGGLGSRGGDGAPGCIIVYY